MGNTHAPDAVPQEQLKVAAAIGDATDLAPSVLLEVELAVQRRDELDPGPACPPPSQPLALAEVQLQRSGAALTQSCYLHL